MTMMQAADAVAGATAAAVASGTGQGSVEAVTHASQAPLSYGFLEVVEYFVTVPMFYLSVLFCVVAIVVKVAGMARARGPYSLALYPERKLPFMAALADALGMRQIARKKPLFWFFLMVFHVGIVLLILGHFDILPAINIVPPESRDMVGAGVVGVMFTLPLFYFLGRRFKGAQRRISVPSDFLLLLLILFTALFGDMMSWGNSWTKNGFVMTKADFALYFDNLWRFTFADPRTVLPGSHYHFVVIHVLLANLFFLILPFSKIVHAFFSIPLNAIRRTVWSRRQAKR